MQRLSYALAAALVGLAMAPPATAEQARRGISRLMAEERSSADLMRDGVAAFERQDHKSAQAYFRELAARGDPSAETLLGTMAANGQGVARNDAVAAAWFLRAARRGYAPAQLALADSFARGRGVPRNLGRARVLAQAAAVQGHPGAAQLAARVTPERYALILSLP